MIAVQRFHILFEYKILVIHIDSKVFNRTVKKYFNEVDGIVKSENRKELLANESTVYIFSILVKIIFP